VRCVPGGKSAGSRCQHRHLTALGLAWLTGDRASPDRPSPCPEEWRGVAALAPAIRGSAERFYRTMPAAVREPLPINAKSFGQPLGVLKSGYVLVENEGGVVVIDLKAALKQLVFERLRSAWEGGSVPSLPMLIPATLGLKEPEVELLMRHSGVLGELGLAIECAGPGTIVIRQVPALPNR
jgi:DNA mismatch repair protein MutL